MKDKVLTFQQAFGNTHKFLIAFHQQLDFLIELEASLEPLMNERMN
jgi:deoxyadenosine/deoxycytidine kinase